jgi:phosphopantothenoylcysteine decarboxylase/phosphopantothenate--cysteine ligase
VDLKGLRVLVTAGGTREPIDPVRFIGNSSSGRMGCALADAAAVRGAHVTAVLANCTVRPNALVSTVDVSTAAELAAECSQAFAECDVLIMAAAVADFLPANVSKDKIKKSDGTPVIELVAAPDVLAGLSEQRGAGQTLVGFAAEHGGDPVENAQFKLETKGLDAIVLNDVSKPGIGFESPDNEVVIITKQATKTVAKASKRAIADAILDEVVVLRQGS